MDGEPDHKSATIDAYVSTAIGGVCSEFGVANPCLAHDIVSMLSKFRAEDPVLSSKAFDFAYDMPNLFDTNWTLSGGWEKQTLSWVMFLWQVDFSGRLSELSYLSPHMDNIELPTDAIHFGLDGLPLFMDVNLYTWKDHDEKLWDEPYSNTLSQVLQPPPRYSNPPLPGTLTLFSQVLQPPSTRYSNPPSPRYSNPLSQVL